MQRNLPNLVSVVGECMELLEDQSVGLPETRSPSSVPLAQLVGECENQLATGATFGEPIRTVHHFACTGGTLICKVLASMPNVQLLSEVEPFSQMARQDPSRFTPTDMVALTQHGSRGGSSESISAVFTGALGALLATYRLRGIRLVLRDHSHSRYCGTKLLTDGPGLLDLARRVSEVASIVTVRHPLDSFLSLHKLGWIAFKPATLEEYCLRYLRFIEDHAEIALSRYEDFVQNPVDEAQRMCEALCLPFNEGFMGLFDVHQLSGDSGRSRGVIAPTVRRPVPAIVQAEIDQSAAYAILCDRLEYPRL